MKPAATDAAEPPLLPPLLLLQPLSPTVEEAPATTRTWKSLSILMGGSLPSTGLATTLVVREMAFLDGKRWDCASARAPTEATRTRPLRHDRAKT